MINVTLHPNEVWEKQPTILSIRFTNTGSELCTKIRFPFRFPREITVLKGVGKPIITISLLKGKQIQEFPITVLPNVAGTFNLISTDFSFFNSLREPVSKSLSIPINVLKKSPSHSDENKQPLSSPPQYDFQRLHKAIVDLFNEEDLRTLCSYLHFSYEDLPASGRANKARELIKYCERKYLVDKFFVLLREERPQVKWPP